VQGYDLSASAAHSHDEHASAVSSGVQVPHMLHLQPAPALTAALDLQPSRQQVQHNQSYHQQQQQQRPDSHTGPLHWFSNGHPTEHGLQWQPDQVQHCQPDQVQQCFLADPLALPQQPPSGQHCHDHSLLQHHVPPGDGRQQLPQQWPGVSIHAPVLPNNQAAPQHLQQQEQQQQKQQQEQQQHGRPLAAFDAQRALPKHLWPAQKQQRELPMQKAPERPSLLQQQQQQQPQAEPRHHQNHQQQQAAAQSVQVQQAQPQPQPQEPQSPSSPRPPRPRQQSPPEQQQPQLHPAQISCRIKQRSSFRALQYLHQHYSSSFNTTNMSGFMVRLAHIHQAQLDAQLQLSAAGQLALQVMQQLVPRLGECQSARQAANAIWALAALQCEVPQGLLQSAAQQLGAQQAQLLRASTPQDVANLAWGLAKLQYNPACSLWLQVVAAAQRQLAGLKPGELAMLLWALADTQQRLKQQRRHQQQQQQQQRLQQVQLRRQQQAAAQLGGSNANTQQPLGELRRPSPDYIVSAQYATRRQSHAEASTSAAASIKAAYIAARRAGNSSSSSRSGLPRRLAQPVWPASRARSVGQGYQQSSSSSSSSSSAGVPNAISGSHGDDSSSTAGAVHSRAAALLEPHLQQLLPPVADVVITQLSRGEQQYGAKETAMLLWACGVLGCDHEGLLTTLAGHQQQQLRAGRSNSQDVANSVWALGKLQVPQPQLLAAAVDQPSWLQSSSRHELSQVLYGTAAVIRQQRLQQADSSKLLPAVALWQATAAQLLAGVGLPDLTVAEAAMILQAAALMLEPVRQPSRRWRQQQQRRPQQEQAQGHQDQDAGDSRSLTASAPVPVSPISTVSSISSMCSMSCSMDSFDEAAMAAPGQARQLMAVIDEELCRQAGAGQLQLPLLGQYVAAVLHSLAAAGVCPSSNLQQMLLSAATAAVPSMDCQELALTAWSAAKLFSGSRSRSCVQGLMEAADRAAGPLLAAMNPQDLSMLAWAHGKLWDLGDSLFMHQLAQAALQQVPQFGPQALSNLAWAFAQLRHYDATLTGAVGRRARVLLGQFTPAELSNLTWALTTLGHRHSGLLRAIGNHAVGQCSHWDSKACAKLIISYCSRGMRTHRYRSMLGTLADALVAKSARSWSRLTPHELVQLAVALAVGRVRHRACTVQIATLALAWLPRIALYDVVSLVWALAMVGQPHDALLRAVSARVASELQAGPSMQHLQLLQQQHGAAASQQQQGAAAAAGQLPGDVAAQQLLHYVQEQQQAGAGGPAGGVLAQHDGSNPSSFGSSSSNVGSSPLGSVPIYAVIGSRLFAPQLARLAWSYKTFAHPDADWYLAAGQLLASAWEPPSSSSRLPSNAHSDDTLSIDSSVGGSSSSGHSSHASGISSTASRRQGVAASGGRPGGDGLQRPVRRPVPAPAATPEHRQGQT
jgi:hypothetical protein